MTDTIDTTPVLAHVPAADLQVEVNIRTTQHEDPDFVRSIRERGVLEPVVGYRTEDGGVAVLMGQRRTRTAQQVDPHMLVPVLVHPVKPTAADRLVDQWVENEHRAGLTNGERVAAVEQMMLEGLSVSQIARRTATPKRTVEAVKTVAGSAQARAAADDLTLEQAAVLAEFDGDDNATERLTHAARRGMLGHVAEQLRQERDAVTAEATLCAQITEAGCVAVERPDYADTITAPLHRLTDSEGQGLSPERHADCPGRVFWVERDYGGDYYDGDDNDEDEDDLDQDDQVEQVSADADAVVSDPEWMRAAVGAVRVVAVEGCRDFPGHGHHDRYARGGHGAGSRKSVADMTEDEREAARAARRHVIESNKAWEAATAVRREWLAQFATRKTAPAGAEALIVQAGLGRWYDLDTPQSGLSLLGWTAEGVSEEVTHANPKRCTHIALALVLARWEAGTHRNTWRERPASLSVVLTAMQGWGYPLSDVETAAVTA